MIVGGARGRKCLNQVAASLVDQRLTSALVKVLESNGMFIAVVDIVRAHLSIVTREQ